MLILPDFQHDTWADLRVGLSRRGNFQGCCHMSYALGMVWRRCVFYFEQPKFKILVAADPIADEGSRQDAIDQLSGLGRTCDKCLDQYTSLWLDRLGRDLPRAVDCLDLPVASMLICSIRVENKDLLGQEL